MCRMCTESTTNPDILLDCLTANIASKQLRVSTIKNRTYEIYTLEQMTMSEPAFTGICFTISDKTSKHFPFMKTVWSKTIILISRMHSNAFLFPSIAPTTWTLITLDAISVQGSSRGCRHYSSYTRTSLKLSFFPRSTFSETACLYPIPN